MWRRLRHGRTWRRIFVERGTEPLHLNLVSMLFVALLGDFRAKVAFDLVIRQHHAYCLLKVADNAKALGKRKVVAVEFGVASGAGLLNMARIAERVTEATGVEFDITASTQARACRGDATTATIRSSTRPATSPMDLERLRAALPSNVHLIIGEYVRDGR